MAFDPYADFDLRWVLENIVKLPFFNAMSRRERKRYLSSLKGASPAEAEAEYQRKLHPELIPGE